MKPTTKPRAITRTWAVTLIFRECSVVTGSADYIVTLTRTADGLIAEVDGQPETLYRAVQMLEMAEKTVVLSEVLESKAPPSARPVLPGCIASWAVWVWSAPNTTPSPQRSWASGGLCLASRH